MHDKRVFTTGDVARLCSVAPRTVSKWFDSGRLRGYRIPGSKDRRIPVDQLVRFMRAHGIPLNGLESGPRLLILDGDPTFGTALKTALQARGGFEVLIATSVFEAGALAITARPAAMLVDLSLPDVRPDELARALRALPELADVRLIAMCPGLSEETRAVLLSDGFAAGLSKPFELAALLECLSLAALAQSPA